MKIDLQWSYNNVQIKEGDKWKVVFITSEGLFKPTVIFFGLMNTLTIFQTMINKILQNLINTGKIASFIDDIIIRTKKEEEHNEIVEKVVRRLTENNLYVKLEKYKQRVWEVRFLEVVIESRWRKRR